MWYERDVRSLHPPGSRRASRPAERLDPGRLEAALDEIPVWEQTLDGSRIYRAFLFRTPEMAPAFATFAYAIGKECGHYPRVSMRESTVVCYLSTPEVDGVTQQDLELARRLSLLE